MGKTIRYFDKKDTLESKSKVKKSDQSTDENVKIYKTNMKPAKWAQRQNNEKLNKIIQRQPNPNPKFPGKAPINAAVKKKYERGEGVSVNGVRLNINKYKLRQKEKAIEFSVNQAARAEILLTESSGLLEADAGETTTQFRQRDIVENVDITAGMKHFELHLSDFGPYRMQYTRNGRHLLLGGRRGHVAAFDWVTKKLHCELNVMESVYDVCWLHIETMFAVAQKNWVYVYDNQGIELHCLKKLNKVSRMQFLPYHFLLATASDEGWLSWLDISIGKLVSQYNSRLGRLQMMCQNPWNATMCVGNTKGVVTMWSPMVREPLAKLLCHKSAMTALHVDPRGICMATSATDRSIKIWDIRHLSGPLQMYRTRSPANNLNFSERGMLGISMGNVVEVYKDCTNILETKNFTYVRHVMNTPVSNIQFCPYEDVLGVATGRGFMSLLVPGSGEPNYDALEANPYQTKKQRREAEVKALLDKIQPEFIALDPTVIAELDVPTLEEKLEEKKKLLFVKPPKLDLTSRKQKKNLSSVKAAKNKKIVQEEAKREFLHNLKQIQTFINDQDDDNTTTNKKVQKTFNVLDRFASNNTKKNKNTP